MRDKFLNSKVYNFEETNFMWHGNPVFQLKTESTENEVILGLTKDPLIFLNELKLDKSKLDPDLLIFASRHTSKTARPAFLVHTTGNWTEDVNFGGESQDLSKTSALLHKAGFFSLIEQDLPPQLKEFSIDSTRFTRFQIILRFRRYKKSSFSHMYLFFC